MGLQPGKMKKEWVKRTKVKDKLLGVREEKKHGGTESRWV